MPTNHIFCDESHTGAHTYRVQGGIWVPDFALDAVRATFAELRAKHPTFREFKWSYVTGRVPLTAYVDLIDLFFRSDVAPLLTFNCLVVHRHDDISRLTDKEGKDVGFFKAYWLLLYYRLGRGSDNHLVIDERSSPRAGPEHDLARCLNSASLRDMPRQPFRVLSSRMKRSHDEDLLQLADVLCGAVGWAYNGMRSTCGAKPILHTMIANCLKVPTLRGYSTAATRPKFNVWLYQPKK